MDCITAYLLLCFSVLLYTEFTDWMSFFARILCAQWRWRVLPVLLCDPQRGDPGSQHPIPVSCQQPFRRWAADCGGWMQLWHPGGHHQGWLPWGTVCPRFIELFTSMFSVLLFGCHIQNREINLLSSYYVEQHCILFEHGSVQIVLKCG